MKIISLTNMSQIIYRQVLEENLVANLHCYQCKVLCGKQGLVSPGNEDKHTELLLIRVFVLSTE